MLAMHVKQALRDLQRGLPGRWPAKLEAVLEAMDPDAQREFLVLARNIGTELIAAERRGATKFLRTGRLR